MDNARAAAAYPDQLRIKHLISSGRVDGGPHRFTSAPRSESLLGNAFMNGEHPRSFPATVTVPADTTVRQDVV